MFDLIIFKSKMIYLLNYEKKKNVFLFLNRKIDCQGL